MQSRTYYNPSTGKIVKVLATTDEEDTFIFDMNAPAGYPYVEGSFDSDIYFISGGVPVVIPPKDSPWLTWNTTTSQWEDQRTVEEYDLYKATVRNSVSISRYDFLKNIKNHPLTTFTNEELQILARGEFPPFIQSVLDGMPPEESENAALKWAAMNIVFREDDLIKGLGTALYWDEFILDELFGIVLYPAPEIEETE